MPQALADYLPFVVGDEDRVVMGEEGDPSSMAPGLLIVALPAAAAFADLSSASMCGEQCTCLSACITEVRKVSAGMRAVSGSATLLNDATKDDNVDK